MAVTSSVQLITLDDWHAVCIGLQVVEAHPLFPYFLEKRLAIPTSPFFIYYSHNAWLQCNSRRLLQVALTINCDLQSLDRRKQLLATLQGDK